MAKNSPAVMRPDVTDVNVETGETIIRPMNDAEYEAWLANASVAG